MTSPRGTGRSRTVTSRAQDVGHTDVDLGLAVFPALLSSVVAAIRRWRIRVYSEVIQLRVVHWRDVQHRSVVEE